MLVDLQLPVSCSPPVSDPGKGEDYIFTCDIGNPLIQNAIVNFHFLLTARSVDPSFEAVTINMHVNRLVLIEFSWPAFADNRTMQHQQRGRRYTEEQRSGVICPAGDQSAIVADWSIGSRTARLFR
jgi:hypothetical protein